MGLREFFSSEHYKPTRVDLEVTKKTVESLAVDLAGPLDVNTAADLLIVASDSIEVEPPGITPAQARIAIKVIRNWRQERRITKETAEAALTRLRLIADKNNNVSVEKVPIEQVASKAREEVMAALDPKVEKEEKQLLASMDMLDRAIYTLGILTSLVSKGTFLREYFSRKRRCVRFDILDRQYTVYVGDGLNGVCDLSYRDGFRTLVASREIEHYWDEDGSDLKSKVIKSLACNRRRFLSSILAEIK